MACVSLTQSGRKGTGKGEEVETGLPGPRALQPSGAGGGVRVHASSCPPRCPLGHLQLWPGPPPAQASCAQQPVGSLESVATAVAWGQLL